MLLADLRQDVADAGRAMRAAGLVRGTSGNVSARDATTGLIAVTPSGAAYDSMTAADVAVIAVAAEADGPACTVVEGAWRPTTELGLHLAVYRSRPEVGAVVHTHSVFATTFAVLGRPVPAVHYILARAAAEVRVAPYARYGSLELAENCVRTLAADDGVLLANHGVIAVGADLSRALAVAEAIETTAELAWRAMTIGNPVVLDPVEMAGVRTDFGGYGRAERSAPPAGLAAVVVPDEGESEDSGHHD